MARRILRRAIQVCVEAVEIHEKRGSLDRLESAGHLL
jgi:hypothetical protein